MKVFVIFLPIMLMKQKMNLFYKHEHKKLNLVFFSHNIIKLQPRTKN